jgi:hypothetical protein
MGPAPALLLGLLAAGPAPLTVTLEIRVADCGGPVRPPEWVAEHVEAVRALLAPHGIAIEASTDSFVPARCEALDRADRDRFAAQVAAGGVVTVLVVPRVRDLDVPTYDLMGVHWVGGGRRWIFLTARARPPVLAHELCHFFGLPHDPAGGNLMTPGPSSPSWRSAHPPRPFAPLLTPEQIKRLRAGVMAWRAR